MSQAKYHEAAQTIERLALRYEGMIAAAKMLRELGSIEQSVEAAQAAVAVENEKADAMRAKIAKLESQARQILADQANKAAELKIFSDRTIASANERAEAIIDAANGEAARIKADGAVAASKSRNDMVNAVSDLAAQKALLDTEVADLKAQKVTATDEADAAEKRLAAVKAQIAALKA